MQLLVANFISIIDGSSEWKILISLIFASEDSGKTNAQIRSSNKRKRNDNNDSRYTFQVSGTKKWLTILVESRVCVCVRMLAKYVIFLAEVMFLFHIFHLVAGFGE